MVGIELSLLTGMITLWPICDIIILHVTKDTYLTIAKNITIAVIKTFENFNS